MLEDQAQDVKPRMILNNKTWSTYLLFLHIPCTDNIAQNSPSSCLFRSHSRTGNWCCAIMDVGETAPSSACRSL